MALFHRNTVKMCQIQRQVGIDSVFFWKRNAKTHLKHLHVNNPTRLQYHGKIRPYLDESSKDLNPEWTQLLEKIYNDPSAQNLSTHDPKRGGWTRRQIDEHTMEELRVYMQHGYSPIDFSVKHAMNVLCNHCDYEQIFPDADVAGAYLAEGSTESDRASKYELPLIFWITPWVASNWRKRDSDKHIENVQFWYDHVRSTKKGTTTFAEAKKKARISEEVSDTASTATGSASASFPSTIFTTSSSLSATARSSTRSRTPKGRGKQDDQSQN